MPAGSLPSGCSKQLTAGIMPRAWDSIRVLLVGVRAQTLGPSTTALPDALAAEPTVPQGSPL